MTSLKLMTPMTIHLDTQSDLEDAIHALVKQDPRLKPIFELTGMPALRQREPGFAGLAHIVCGQQLSTASAGGDLGPPHAPRSIRSIMSHPQGARRPARPARPVRRPRSRR